MLDADSEIWPASVDQASMLHFAQMIVNDGTHSTISVVFPFFTVMTKPATVLINA